MTIIRPNSISGITSITSQTTDQLKLYKSSGSPGDVLAGVITATKYVGPFDGTTGAFSGDVTISGDLGVAGTLTYEDVARVDAVGLSTFREGFGVGPLAGIALTAYKDGSIRTTGVITATTYYGSGANLTNLPASGPTLANGANDRVVTATGANALTGEATLTFDGNNLKVKANTEGNSATLQLIADEGDDAADNWRIMSAASDNALVFSSSESTERLRIRSDGSVQLGPSPALAAVGSGPTFGINGSAPEITLRDTASGNPYAWIATNDHGSLVLSADNGNNASSSIIDFRTDGSQRARIDSSGNLLIGTTSATSELTVKGGGTVAAFEGTGGSVSLMLKDVDDSTLAYALVDGGNFDIQTSGSSYATKLRVTPSGAVQARGASGDAHLCLHRTNAAGSNGNTFGNLYWNDNNNNIVARIRAIRSTAVDDADLLLETRPAGGSSTERMRIKADGEIVMGLQAGVAYDTDTLFVNGPTNSGKATMEVLGNGNNSPQANTTALHVKQNCTSAPDTSPALKLTHTNPLAGNEGAVMTIYSNTNNSTAQRSWGIYSTGRIIHNRPAVDGTLFSFRHNNTAEGSISISGGSVSYNGGVLTRWSQLVGISTNVTSDRPTIYQGTVMSNLDEMCEWADEENMQLNKTKVSTASSDKNVAGVFWGWDDDDVYTNDFYIAQTGDFIIRVAASTSVMRGDLLESAGDGTAKPQSDDIVRSKTIAKITSVTSTATYADGSKAYPCVLMAC